MTTKRKRISDKSRKEMLKDLNFQDPAQNTSFNHVIDYVNQFYQRIDSSKKAKIDPNQKTIYDEITH